MLTRQRSEAGPPNEVCEVVPVGLTTAVPLASEGKDRVGPDISPTRHTRSEVNAEERVAGNRNGVDQPRDQITLAGHEFEVLAAERDYGWGRLVSSVESCVILVTAAPRWSLLSAWAMSWANARATPTKSVVAVLGENTAARPATFGSRRRSQPRSAIAGPVRNSDVTVAESPAVCPARRRWSQPRVCLSHARRCSSRSGTPEAFPCPDGTVSPSASQERSADQRGRHHRCARSGARQRQVPSR